MAEKRYAFIENFRIEVPTHCRVCNLDVSADLRTSHVGRCSECGRDTEHVIAFPGCPWHCAEAHPLDDILCYVCDAELPEPEARIIAVERGARNISKRLCSNCDPLKDLKPPGQ